MNAKQKVMAESASSARRASRRRRQAGLVAIAAILSNVVSIVKAFKELGSVLGLHFHSISIPNRTPFVVGALAAVDALLFASLYYIAAARFKRSKAAALAAATVIAGPIFLLNFLILPARPVPIDERVRHTLVDQLAALQSPTDGGFSIFTAPASGRREEDAWTTAQALTAILSANIDIERRGAALKAAFAYIEAHRDASDPEGWTQGATSRITRTDIAAWVTIAYVKSLATGAVWDGADAERVASRIDALLTSISMRQDPLSGGWTQGPVVVPQRVLTYPTIMSLWALAEGLGNPVIATRLGHRFDFNVDAGVRWLLRTYRSGRGWFPNPRVELDNCDGLNAQALFVLLRTELFGGTRIANYRQDATYVGAKREFLARQSSATPLDKPCRPQESLLQEDGENLFVSFVSYPWELAASSSMRADGTLDVQARREANRVAAALITSSKELVTGFPSAYTFQMAETLTSLSIAAERH